MHMKNSKRFFQVLSALAILVIVLSSSFQSQKVKVTGTWNLKVETSAGSGTPVFVLKQENDTLITGTYTGQFGESAVKGSIRESKIVLMFSASDMDIVYTGTVEGNNMKGKVAFGTMAEGTFTGIRKTDK
jgi:hypothetical protein